MKEEKIILALEGLKRTKLSNLEINERVEKKIALGREIQDFYF